MLFLCNPTLFCIFVVNYELLCQVPLPCAYNGVQRLGAMLIFRRDRAW